MTIEHLRELHQQPDEPIYLPCPSCDAPQFVTKRDIDLLTALDDVLPHLLDIAEAANNLNLNHPDKDWGINKLHEALAQLEET